MAVGRFCGDRFFPVRVFSFSRLEFFYFPIYLFPPCVCPPPPLLLYPVTRFSTGGLQDPVFFLPFGLFFRRWFLPKALLSNLIQACFLWELRVFRAVFGVFAPVAAFCEFGSPALPFFFLSGLRISLMAPPFLRFFSLPQTLN